MRKLLVVLYTALILGANPGVADVASLLDGDMKKLMLWDAPVDVPEAVLAIVGSELPPTVGPVWQLMQLTEPDGMCPLGLPTALLLLWQLAQLVAAVKLLWSGLAPVHPLVLWQLSQLVTPE